MIETILAIFIVLCGGAAVCLLLFATYYLIKNENTYKNQRLICDAIFAYQIFLINNGIYKFDVDYGDIEDYDKTLCRWWDWGYTKILPNEKFEIIKPHIKTKRSKI